LRDGAATDMVRALGGARMSPFEFYFSFYGLLLGLSVAEVTGGFANALSARRAVTIGWLTPLLATFLMLDIASYWLTAWATREAVTEISLELLFAGLIVAVTYYLAAALIFPRQIAEWPILDDHYWAHKRFVLGGVLVANLIVMGLLVSVVSPPLRDPLFYLFHVPYWLALAGLLASRSRRLDTVLLAVLIANYLLEFVLPAPAWGA
jgi:hypothetical protein